MQGHIFASWINPLKEQKFVVCGEAGMIVFDDTAPWDKKLIHYRHQFVPEPGGLQAKTGAAEPIVVPAALAGRDRPFHLACVKTRPRPRTDAAESQIRVLRVLRACDEALASGGRIELPRG